jgi:hypothetical protein
MFCGSTSKKYSLYNRNIIVYKSVCTVQQGEKVKLS